MKRDPIYGTMAEFDTPQALIDAAKRTHEAGYKKIDAYSPFPIEGLAEEIGFHFNEVPLVVLIGGIIGGHFSDRWGRRRTIIIAFILGALLVPVWAFAPNQISRHIVVPLVIQIIGTPTLGCAFWERKPGSDDE